MSTALLAGEPNPKEHEILGILALMKARTPKLLSFYITRNCYMAPRGGDNKSRCVRPLTCPNRNTSTSKGRSRLGEGGQEDLTGTLVPLGCQDRCGGK